MAEIVPFRGIRYAAPRGRALGQLLAPPCDLVSQEKRDELLLRSPHNVIHLTMGDERMGDGPANNKYTRAAERWNDWLAQGVLRADPAPSFYPLEQSFWSPDDRRLQRRGFVAAARLHEFHEGVIVPHEKTHFASKADRLELLKAVKANLSPIMGFYRDEQGATAKALAATFEEEEPAAETDSDDGVHHRLWRVSDPGRIGILREILAPRRIFIADGHLRYEMALVYRRMLEESSPGLPREGGHHFILMFLCPMSDPGLILLPTHRLLSGLEGFSLPRLLEGLARFFTIETLPEDIRRPAGRAWAVSKLAEHLGKSTAFLMLTAEDQRARVITLRDDVDLTEAELPANETLRALDVTVLQSIVFKHLLGLSPGAQESLTYAGDAGEAVNSVLSGRHQVGFLLNPTPMWQVAAIGDSGEKMPQRSTLFYPRLQSGLVMRAVDPRESP